MTIRSHFLGAALVAPLAAALAGNATAEVRKIDNIEYAKVAEQTLHLDLYQPAGAATAPLVVFVHGGAWESGDKNAMPLRPLVERGFAVASLDFRPASAAPFPAQVHEIKAALRFLRANAARYGYDARRIAIAGVSSGAHLAALVGTTNGNAELEGTLGDHRDQSSAVQVIVSYFGASNLTTILAQSTPFGVRVRTPALERLLGGLPDQQTATARLASPVFHVDANDPPLLLLHGDQDPQMPINQSHELQGAYEKVGVPAELIVLHGAGHGGDAFFDADRIARVTAFLDTHLREEKLSATETLPSAR